MNADTQGNQKHEDQRFPLTVVELAGRDEFQVVEAFAYRFHHKTGERTRWFSDWMATTGTFESALEIAQALTIAAGRPAGEIHIIRTR